jgi:hypothetical protein
MSTDEDPIRAQARKSIKRKQDFWRFFWVWIAVSILLSAIWFFTGDHHYFWPGWAIGGIAIGLFFTGLDAYGPGKKIITDEDIDAEIARNKR